MSQITLQQLEQITQAIDIIWISVCTYLIFLMQLGFAFLEAGSIRLKNLQAILFKNLIDISINTVAWWLVGYAFAFGDQSNPFIGTQKFAAIGVKSYANFLFQWAFAGTSATIVSGCIAERMTIHSYLIFSSIQVAWVYPLLVHWTWAQGWLYELGYSDFAGGGIVHVTGGSAGLIATVFIGARIDRFSPSKQEDFKPNNITFCILGSMLLWFSWYGFNCGSTLKAVGDATQAIPLIGMNTSLSAVSAALSGVILHYIQHRKTNEIYSTTVLCNGFLSGLVAITSGCQAYEPYAAFIIGAVSGMIYYSSSKLLYKIKIDDPLGAVPVHFFCGIWAVISTGLFHNLNGLFYSGSFKLLGMQVLGLIVIISWVLLNSLIILIVLKQFKILRELPKTELLGLDNVALGGSPYNYDNTTIKALQLLKTAEEVGVIQRMVPQNLDIQRDFIIGVEKRATLYQLDRSAGYQQVEQNN